MSRHEGSIFALSQNYLFRSIKLNPVDDVAENKGIEKGVELVIHVYHFLL